MSRPRIPTPLKPLAVPMDQVHPDPANARTHDDRNLQSLAASLKRFGQQKPIIVDADGVIVAGNATHQAALSLGWTEVAAVRTTLAGPDRTAYAIADNRTAEAAGRTAYLMELDPAYCDVIVQRFTDTTGQEARRP